MTLAASTPDCGQERRPPQRGMVHGGEIGEGWPVPMCSGFWPVQVSGQPAPTTNRMKGTMTHLEEIHQRAVNANKHFTEAMVTFHDPTIQAAEAAQALHEVIAAIDAIYLHLESKHPNRLQLLKNRINERHTHEL